MKLIGYILLAVLAVLILLIFFVPYGVDAAYEDGVFRLGIQAGPFRIGLYPKKPPTPRQIARRERKKSKKQAAAEEKDAAEPDAEKPPEEKKEKLDETEKIPKKRELDLDTILALLKMGVHAIRRFFRSFTVNYFKLHCTVASRDPYTTAMEYAALCSTMEALPAMCGPVIRVHRRDIVIGSDFLSEAPTFSGRITLTLQLFRLVHLAVAFLVEYLIFTIKRRAAKKAAASERKDENGRQPTQ